MRKNFSELNLSKCADGLLPVIIQDSRTLKVLMLGYMNEEAYDKTVAEGKVTFYSRSRRTLWTKGETSGNFLYVDEIFTDSVKADYSDDIYMIEEKLKADERVLCYKRYSVTRDTGITLKKVVKGE